MAEIAEHPDVEQGTKKTIYWPHPAFTSEGTVDATKMVDFLIHDVPNNHFRKEIPNTWNSWKEFEVHFLDAEKRETIVFKCVLKVTGRKNKHSVECILCEPKNPITFIMNSRAQDIADLISGRPN